ncbi:hypothetical protein AAFF_G00398010 [Aldrovandia affinis]|uniref:VWA7 Ig-like domain-containing protein n=1 Tax=Aldrovandia affinis TaxID=143900 RepID=A0AAD7SDE6_9TELE|nr:hypothetical protein AAFF_G00398010 [Aldrovandia affinis]
MVSVPRQPFCVRLSGRDARRNILERVSTEMIQPTHIQIQVLSVPHLVPGHASVVIFDLWNHGPTRYFTLTAVDDRGFLTEREPHRLSVAERGSLRGQVEVKTPGDTELGGAVTLTLTVRALDSVDANYAVVHLSVVPQDPDMTSPSCSLVHVEANCPPPCGQASWTVSLVVADRGRSGLAALQLSNGTGILTLLPGLGGWAGKPWQQEGRSRETESAGRRDLQGMEEPRLLQGNPPLNVSGRGAGAPLHVRYTASCCSPQAELLAWDGAGNMRRCHLTSKISNAAGRTGLALLTLVSGLLLGAGLMV